MGLGLWILGTPGPRSEIYRTLPISEEWKMKCPKCGHEWPAKNQVKGGKNRWKGMNKKQRSEEMKRVRAKGITKGKK